MGTVTKTIGTGTRDFSTIALWIASLPANLVTDGNSYVGQCFNDSEFTITSSLTFSGITTDATHTITLTTGTGQSFKDNVNAQTNALKYNVSNGVGIKGTGNYFDRMIFSNGVDYIFISGIQVNHTGSNASTSAHGLLLEGSSTANGPFVSQCIFQDTGTSNSTPILGGASLQVTNCLLIAGSSSANSGGVNIADDNNSSFFVNNTIVRPSDLTTASNGFRKVFHTYSGGHTTIKNNTVFNFSGFIDTVGNVQGSNNATDLASVGFGTSNQTSLTYTSQFQGTTSAAPDFRAKTGGGIIDNGATDTTDIPAANDIVGTSRPQGSAWDIGAWELVQAGGSPVPRRTLMGVGI